MFALSTVVLTGIAAFIGGGLVGILAARQLNPQEQRNKELEAKLAQAEEKLLSYQNDVSEHFAETSKLVNNLTKDYKEVYEHLANSALKLTNPDISRQLIEASKGTLPEHAETDVTTSDNEHIEPPRDWAPKTPGSAGTLSEDFGLLAEDEAAEISKSKNR